MACIAVGINPSDPSRRLAFRSSWSRRTTSLFQLGRISSLAPSQGLLGLSLRDTLVAAGECLGRGLGHEIIRLAGVKPAARFVIAEGSDGGWTTNMPLNDFQQMDVILADTHDDVPISDEHGGPVRLVVPRLYAWKSAKWCCSLSFLDHDEPGLWEQQGYHNHGDPWNEERFGSETLPPGWREEAIP